jgi:hypothetical protein
MGDRVDAEIPAALSRAHRKMEQWRQRHRRGARIAEELWCEAAELARAYGINRTAKALRLDYYSLKKRAAAAARSGGSIAGFVELLPGGIPAPSVPQPVCTIEVEDGGGVKMRIRLEGGALPDVAALTRVFREGR